MQWKTFHEEPMEKQLEIAKFEGWEKMVLMTGSALRGVLDSAAEESREVGCDVI